MTAQMPQTKGFNKFILIIILAYMSAIAPLSTDMYLPALPQVQQSFATSAFWTQISIASFFVGFALGQLIYGPLSDIFGRKKPLYAGLLLFILASAGCLAFDSIYSFVAMRFLQALGGCAGAVIARAIVNDCFNLKEAAGVFALMMVVGSLAPMLSPIFGGFLLDFFSWHSIFVVLFALGVLLVIFIALLLRESAPNILQKSANISQNTKQSTAPKFSFKIIANSYKMILCDHRYRIYALSSGFCIATMFAYITGSSYLFCDFFGLSPKGYSLLFGLNAISFMLFANINARLVLKFSPYAVLPWAFLIMLICAILLCFAGFLGANLWIFEIILFVILGMNGFIVPNATALAMARFKANAGSASAILGALQFALAGAISFIVSALSANSPLPLALVISGSLLIACGFYFYLNPRLLKKSLFGIKRFN